MTWRRWVDEELDAIRTADRWRTTRSFDAFGPRGELDGHGPVVSFASNDYLGLSTHPAVLAAAHAALDRWGAGATASRLVVGNRPVHEELEAELAEWKGAEAALVLPTGYAANLAVLAALAGPGVSVVSDELNHASIIDGIRLSRASVLVYAHGDVEQAGSLLARGERALLVSDSVFSMDGDVADVVGLARCCAATGALLVLDEAHAVLGPDVARELAATGATVLRVGTLSKALGALGGFVAGPRPLIDLLRNRARPSIFTTGLPPADAAAALAALRVLRSDEGAALVARLGGHVEAVRPGHPSPIVPVVLGSEERALAAAGSLLAAGLLVPAIRPPTVAAGTSRLRVALSAAHTGPEVARLVAALAALDAGALGEVGDDAA